MLITNEYPTGPSQSQYLLLQTPSVATGEDRSMDYILIQIDCCFQTVRQEYVSIRVLSGTGPANLTAVPDRVWEDLDMILDPATGQPWGSWGSLFISVLNFKDEHIRVCFAPLTGGRDAGEKATSVEEDRLAYNLQIPTCPGEGAVMRLSQSSFPT